MTKKLAQIFKYIDEEEPESISEMTKWIIKNNLWEPLYTNIIREYLDNHPILEYNNEYEDELERMDMAQGEKRAGINAKRILDHIEEVKEDDYREFLNWLNRSNLMKDYLMGRGIFEQCYVEHMDKLTQDRVRS